MPIPKPLRQRLGIRPGSALEFTEESGGARLVATKATYARCRGERVRSPRVEAFNGRSDDCSTNRLTPLAMMVDPDMGIDELDDTRLVELIKRVDSSPCCQRDPPI